MSAKHKQSQYRIPSRTKLIIVDAHDTIFKPDLSRTEAEIFNDPMKKERITWMLRYGFLNFIEYFSVQKNIDIVISSDGQKKRLTQIAQQFGVYDQLKAIYGAEHIDKWDYLKRLDKILSECQTEAQDAVFIGDSQVDMFSAEKYGVPFIQVPNTIIERAFSFNSFLEIDFDSGDYGLELIDLHQIKQISHNLSTPQLVEEAIRRQEGVLAHLGPLVINKEKHQSADDTKVYIVKEPSSENEISWSEDIFPFDMEAYHTLFSKLKDFLHNQSVYIQDCFAGSEASCRIPLRIITQNAWHNLFVRHMFRQATEEEMAFFFPEYTLVHIPELKVSVDQDEATFDNMILINLLKKMILIVGTNSTNVIRKAVFLTLSFILPKNDMIPVRCSANKGDDGSLALFFSEDQAQKNSLCLNTNRSFFGDDCHGWTQDGFTNIEWGCRTHVDGLNIIQDPEIFPVIREFSTILENIEINEKRRLQFKRQNPKYHAIASFPITHLRHADRSGIAPFPRHLFILVKDAMGVLPALGKLTHEQASIFLLLGYGSEWKESEESDSPTIYYHPLYNSDPSISSEPFYQALLYETLPRSKSQCWLLNTKPLGHHKNLFATADQQLLQRFVFAVQSDDTQHIKWDNDSYWKFPAVHSFEDYPETLFNPKKAWETDSDQFLKSNKRLKRSFSVRLSSYHNTLPISLKNVVDWFIDREG
ncbi:MAG: phosphoenolpyruvate carboxykinase (ATP) [Planctomycetes bacterium]|nr:phosphoenolpyruvate carboxykinase (ATP) [Planctomycetota bacterium]